MLSDAGMNSISERQMLPRVGAADIEGGRLAHHAFVAIGRAEQQQDVGAGGHRDTADFGVLQGFSPPCDDGGRVPQTFVDGGRNLRGIATIVSQFFRNESSESTPLAISVVVVSWPANSTE